MTEITKIIEKQRAGHETEPRYAIGSQLLDIAKREPKSKELLLQDLQHDGMSLADAEKMFKKYADENHKKATCFCITPEKAEELLRKFYGLGEAESAEESPRAEESFLDLGNFL